MNKDWLTQLAADEQPTAKELLALADDMRIAPAFEWTLENKLMQAHSEKTQPARSWLKFARPLGWALAALAGLFLAFWGMRTLNPIQPATETVLEPQVPFAVQVGQGDLCAGPLAVGHHFDVSLSNAEKTGLVTLDAARAIGELRSFAWSPDGKTLALVGNTAGSGNVYLTDTAGKTLTPILEAGTLGYLMDANWSHDGKQLAGWSAQANTSIFLIDRAEKNVTTIEVGLQIFSAPQFGFDDQRLFFYGADSATAGLFEWDLVTSKVRVVSARVEDAGGFAVSPDGTQLVFAAKDRLTGEMRLVREDLTSGEQLTLGTLPIPTGSGSAVPETANMTWSTDGTRIAFEFGRGQAQRTIYLAQADGSALEQVVSAAHAPAFSADGNCLAYINAEKQVLILNVQDLATPPFQVSDLPTGRATADFKLDKLQWGR